jgi:uncharacterized protein (TIGR01777 family)
LNFSHKLKKMILALTGANGFIGSQIQKKFHDIASEILILNRNDSDDIWTDNITKADVIINLAGSPVFKRWNERNKKIILESRIKTTQRIVSTLNQLTSDMEPKLLISASATGIYPDDKFQQFHEYSNSKGSGFLAEVVSRWEAEADELVNPSVRLVIIRLGVVLSRKGGMLKLILPIFRFGLGGIIGSGKQIITFIHIEDLLDALLFFFHNEKTSGLYNLVSPNPITNKEFTRILAKKIHRPALFRVPSFILTILYGQASCIMLNGAHVYPQRLINQGFTFKYPTFKEAIDNVLN